MSNRAMTTFQEVAKKDEDEFKGQRWLVRGEFAQQRLRRSGTNECALNHERGEYGEGRPCCRKLGRGQQSGSCIIPDGRYQLIPNHSDACFSSV